MAIVMMCEPTAPGAVRDDYWSKQSGHEIWRVTTHVGLVLGLREMNGYDDSDFYAIVWNAEKQTTEEVMYATTRGWTYPNGASVDATPEVRAAYDAKVAAERKAAQERRDAIERKTPYKGRRVRVVKAVTRGKNTCPAGEEGESFWYGKDTMKLAKHTRYLSDMAASMVEGLHDPRTYYRVGVRLLDGKRVFMPALNVEVIEE